MEGTGPPGVRGQLADLNGAYRHLQLSADDTDAAWAALYAALSAAEQQCDQLTLLADDERRFEAARAGDLRVSVPLHQELRALARVWLQHAARLRAAVAACAEQDTALRTNVQDFLLMAITQHLQQRLPDETASSRAGDKPPLPRVNLANPALGDAVNNVGDDAPPNATFAHIHTFG
jgi:hypothetical protein